MNNMTKEILPKSEIFGLFEEILDDGVKNSVLELCKNEILPAFIEGLSEISIVKPVKIGLLTYSNIRDHLLRHRLRCFIKQLRFNLTTQETEEFKHLISSDEKKFGFCLLFIIEQLYKCDSDHKAKIIGELFKSCVIKNQLNWEAFERISATVVNAHFNSFDYLYDFYLNRGGPSIDKNAIILKGGDFPPNEASLIMGSGFGSLDNNRLAIWKDAIDLCRYGLEEIYSNKYELIPTDFTHYLREHRVQVLNDPYFTDYERKIFHYNCDSSCASKLRTDSIDRIKKYIKLKCSSSP